MSEDQSADAPLHRIENEAGKLSEDEIKQLREKVIEALKTVYDPEIPVDIYELGLIYDLKITPAGYARIEMTLTSPACPVAESLPGEVESRVASVEGIQDAQIELVWDPPWSQERMSEAARLELGFM